VRVARCQPGLLDLVKQFFGPVAPSAWRAAGLRLWGAASSWCWPARGPGAGGAGGWSEVGLVRGEVVGEVGVCLLEGDEFFDGLPGGGGVSVHEGVDDLAADAVAFE